jgi:hypothetical protein
MRQAEVEAGKKERRSRRKFRKEPRVVERW